MNAHHYPEHYDRDEWLYAWRIVIETERRRRALLRGLRSAICGLLILGLVGAIFGLVLVAVFVK